MTNKALAHSKNSSDAAAAFTSNLEHWMQEHDLSQRRLHEIEATSSQQEMALRQEIATISEQLEQCREQASQLQLQYSELQRRVESSQSHTLDDTAVQGGGEVLPGSPADATAHHECLEDEIVQLISEKRGMTEQQQLDQAQIQRLRDTIAELQHEVGMLRAQQHGATQQQYMPSTPFMASPGFTPGFPQGLPLSSPALPNPLAQQWQFTAPQMSSPPPIPHHMFGQPVTGAASGMFGQPMTGAASGLSGPVPTLSSLDPTQFGATNAAQLEEAKHRLSALEQLRRD